MEYLSLITRSPNNTAVITDSGTQGCLELGDAHQVLVNEVYQLVEMTCDELNVSPSDGIDGLVDATHEFVGELLDVHSLRLRIKEVISEHTVS